MNRVDIMSATANPYTKRYRGTFVMENAHYGFIVRVFDTNAEPVLFPGEGGCFVSGSALKQTLGNRGSILKDLDGSCVSFSVRIKESGKHQGKPEAYDVHELTGA